MKVLDKFVDVLGKPINFNFLMASFLTSLFLLATNFLPVQYLNKLHLEVFLDKYNYVVIIVFFVSFFLLVIHFTARRSKKKEDAAFNKFYSEKQDDMFQDYQSLEILEELYREHPDAVRLPMYNQKVKLLEQYGLITKASSQAIVNMRRPTFPYILQPIAEDRLKKMHSEN
ncbi:MAG: superinfection exclusion B family protein [Lactococcus lactis]|nr:superinfection exclusion B family protein [Lactococcus lactis]MDN6055009.1 superinfection exclusion B family protein [Lactococcus lactis]